MKSPPGLFITGTDTDVGKTYVAAMIVKALRARGCRVGVYKPAASGCFDQGDRLVADDAVRLWEAADRPCDLDQVCPQKFVAPLAPHLAAREEGKRLDAELLRRGIAACRHRSDVVVVEGAGGLMSPLGEDEYVADLAWEFGYPLVVVSRNTLGTIHQTLATLVVAATFRQGLHVAGVVLNNVDPAAEDASRRTNRDELDRRAIPPLLAEVAHGAECFDPPVDWLKLARRGRPTT